MTWIHEHDAVRIARLRGVGPFDNNVYVVAGSGGAVIVDPAAEADAILDAVAGLDVTGVVVTHGHFDHIGALNEVTEALNVEWRMHLADQPIAERTPDAPLEDGDVIDLGSAALHVVHTPGHTPGQCRS